MSDNCLADTASITLNLEGGAMRADARVSADPNNALGLLSAGLWMPTNRKPTTRINRTTSVAVGSPGLGAFTLNAIRWALPPTSVVASQFVAPVSGIYRVCWSIAWQGSAGASNFRVIAMAGQPSVFLQVEWVTAAAALLGTFTTTWVVNSFQGLVYFRMGETVSLFVQMDQVAASNIIADSDASLEFEASLLLETA